MIKVFAGYSDPAHGWAKVSKKVLRELGIDKQISDYSYQRGEYAYLEEDCDLTLFVDAYKARYGFEPRFTDNWTNKMSKIRSYASYAAD